MLHSGGAGVRTPPSKAGNLVLAPTSCFCPRRSANWAWPGGHRTRSHANGGVISVAGNSGNAIELVHLPHISHETHRI